MFLSWLCFKFFSLKEIVGYGLNLETEQGVGSAAWMIKFSFCIVPIKLSSPQNIQYFFNRGDWFFDHTPDIEIFILVFI